MFKKEKLDQAEESKTATLTIECSYWYVGHINTLIYTDDNSIAIDNDVIRRDIPHIVDKNRVIRLTDEYDTNTGGLTPDKGEMKIEVSYTDNNGVTIINDTDFYVTSDTATIGFVTG